MWSADSIEDALRHLVSLPPESRLGGTFCVWNNIRNCVGWFRSVRLQFCPCCFHVSSTVIVRALVGVRVSLGCRRAAPFLHWVLPWGPPRACSWTAASARRLRLAALRTSMATPACHGSGQARFRTICKGNYRRCGCFASCPRIGPEETSRWLFAFCCQWHGARRPCMLR